ncbi:hypothetical protein GCM10010387_21780 [Streptomyces inusitatus]|uniref:Uncharacterized protein n=1 Tax=Streptomyces inusitatus TaxID=68221 RepID=A0A918PZC2_9ACTN|nr:hypothetical protein [Streptomyces inusitatus]GGZ28020.1 hypothetical protein GCM10010387_21780 [Streptomyces inusitatus]
MSELLSFQSYFARCSERSDKVGFSLRDGREFLGWVVEVEESRILVSWAPGPFDDPVDDGDGEDGDEWVAFASIRPGTVGHYDRTVRRWVSMFG